MFTSTRVIAAAAIVALFGGVVYFGSPSPPAAEAEPSPPLWMTAPAVAWNSGLVALNAGGMRIRAGDKVFASARPDEGVMWWDVGSDPGDAGYRTLEVEWV